MSAEKKALWVDFHGADGKKTDTVGLDGYDLRLLLSVLREARHGRMPYDQTVINGLIDAIEGVL